MSPPGILSPADAKTLVAGAQLALGMTHDAFANALGVSKRTSPRRTRKCPAERPQGPSGSLQHRNPVE